MDSLFPLILWIHYKVKQLKHQLHLSMLGSKLQDLFFSAKWGLAVATPLWFAGFIGLLIPGPVSKSIRVASLASLISLIVVMLSFVESDAYGNRYFIAAAVLFTIGLANLMDRCFRNKVMGYATIVFIVACVISSIFNDRSV